MKFVFIDTYYSGFIKYFYKNNPNLELCSYQEQKEKLLAKKFGTADFYSSNLEKMGHQAEDLIANCESLQKRWAEERHWQPVFWPYLKRYWMEKILITQIQELSPDVVYFLAPFLLTAKMKSAFRKKILVAQISSPLSVPASFFKNFDLVLSSFPHYVERFGQEGVNVRYFRLAFEKTILSGLQKGKQYPVTFVGGFSRHHANTLELIQYVAAKVPVDFWGYGYENFPENSDIRKNYHGQAWGKDMYQILFNSGITLNRHGAVAQNFANNMRLFEATGVGSLLITDYKDNLNDLYLVGKEIEAYRSKEELVDKIKYYLSHKKERERIAAAGQKRTLRDHTYQARMKELNEILKRS